MNRITRRLANRTTNWMKADYKEAYIKVFDEIYIKHKKPTEEDCAILNISMEEALKLRSEGYRIENRQRQDSLNFSEFRSPEVFEVVTNKKKPGYHIMDESNWSRNE